MVSIVQLRPRYNYVNYEMFCIGNAAHHHSLYDWFWGVRCSCVEFNYLVSFLILLLMSYLIIVITSITDMFMSMATSIELQIYTFWH